MPGAIDFEEAFLDRVAALQAKLVEAEVPITLIAGGELNLADLDLFTMEDDEIPSFGMSKRYVLFDFWSDELPGDYWDRINRLRAMGATPIQAHPERIAAFQRYPALLDELAGEGVLLQGNLQCFSDKAGTRMRSLAERWLTEGRYFVLGSDAHRLDTLICRLDGLKRAIQLVGMDAIDRLTITNAAVVTGI